MQNDWQGKRVVVMGLGRFGGGVGVTRWLAAAGAKVLVTDQAPAEKLSESLAELASCSIELRLGGHDERDFRSADVVVVNPAVPPASPFLQTAQRAGVPITTEMNLFLERCPAACIGITGSVGKSTTTAMIGHVLERTLRDQRIWVGGNLGISLLDALPRIGRSDRVVLELSSFQLERIAAIRWRPRIAVITNLAPNHLDWHGSMDAYAAAKLNLLRFQDRSKDTVIIGDSDALAACVRGLIGPAAPIWRYGIRDGSPGAWRESPGDRRDATSSAAGDGGIRWPGLHLATPGRHNLQNAAAALTVAHLLGVPASEAMGVIATFEGLPHRLQRVAVRDGVSYVNDSKSTTPEAAVTAMDAIDGPLLMIMGGYDKGIDLSPASRAAARRARFVACIGQTGATVAEQIRLAGGSAEVFTDLAGAVEACRRQARAGETVLLSPACASWDMFEDYRARGDEFARAAAR
jgi:UDP-N-acetylmuramoylalanine--D-glutamate ligase